MGGTAAGCASPQDRWASGGSSEGEAEHDGREPCCEDEGAQCEDEPDLGWSTMGSNGAGVTTAAPRLLTGGRGNRYARHHFC